MLASLLETYRCVDRFENLGYAADQACFVAMRSRGIECGNLSARGKQRHAALAIRRLGELLKVLESLYHNEIVPSDLSQSISSPCARGFDELESLY